MIVSYGTFMVEHSCQLQVAVMLGLHQCPAVLNPDRLSMQVMLAVMSIPTLWTMLPTASSSSSSSRQEYYTSRYPPHSSDRTSRFLSVFTIHRFTNSPCQLDSGDAGTCFTVGECRRQGGVTSGSCAGGYGVCCALFATCGSDISRNNTYFVNKRYPQTSAEAGTCVVHVQLSAGSDQLPVCQLRLDLQQLQLAAPDAKSHQCVDDQFIVSGDGQAQPLVICGNNTGHHIYVDVGGASSVTVAVSRKSQGALTWAVGIQRIACGAIFSAPPGCQQYYTGNSGRITSFNFLFDQGAMPSDLDYSVCIRRSAGRCGVAFRQCDDSRRPATTFTVSGDTRIEPRTSQSGDLCTSDWLEIGCGTDRGVPPYHVTSAGYVCTSRFCGLWLNALDGAGTAGTVYSFLQPFVLRVHTNNKELKDPVAADYGNRGFCLQYSQVVCET